MSFAKKFKIIIAVIALVIGFFLFLFTLDFSHGKNPDYGVTFSKKYALELGLNWRDAYRAMFTDLHVDHVRLIAYWDDTEPAQDHYDFTDLDWQVSEAQRNGAQILMTVGRRTPRWPECHDPSWLGSLNANEQKKQLMDFVETVVDRYKGNAAVVQWQVENEPLFGWFGNCPAPDADLLTEEVRLVHTLDSRPVVITDSGELNHWQSAADIGDVLGITMYRIVWNPHFGFFDYWFIPPAGYTYKGKITQFFHRNLQNIIVTELQMEPWTLNKSMAQMTLQEQQQSFDLKRFQANVAYVKRTGFSQAYLWGVEYWYWQKTQGNPELWDEAKKLWQ